MDRFFYFPDFPFWSTAVGRRIHDNGIVMIAAADLTLYEFYAVIDDPADRRIAQSGRTCIFLCPGDHALGGIYVCNARSGSGSGKRSTAGIGKEVQNFDRAAGILIFSENQSQLVACSGNRPVCLKLKGFN